MVKKECQDLIQDLFFSHSNMVRIAERIGDGEWDPSMFLHHMDESKDWFKKAKKTGYPKGEFDNAMSRFINPMVELMNKQKGVDEADVETDELMESITEFTNGYYKWLLDMFTVCECHEMDHMTLKIPIEKSDTVEAALKNAGYDVGTDAYYSDPDKYVSVIVSATKELELRRGGRQ